MTFDIISYFSVAINNFVFYLYLAALYFIVSLCILVCLIQFLAQSEQLVAFLPVTVNS